MKKKAIILVLLTVLLLSGCDSGNSSAKTDTKKTDRFVLLSKEPLVSGRIIYDSVTGVQYLESDTGYFGHLHLQVLRDEKRKMLLVTDDTPRTTRLRKITEDKTANGYIMYDSYTRATYLYSRGAVIPLLDADGNTILHTD